MDAVKQSLMVPGGVRAEKRVVHAMSDGILARMVTVSLDIAQPEAVLGSLSYVVAPIEVSVTQERNAT